MIGDDQSLAYDYSHAYYDDVDYNNYEADAPPSTPSPLQPAKPAANYYFLGVRDDDLVMTSLLCAGLAVATVSLVALVGVAIRRHLRRQNQNRNSNVMVPPEAELQLVAAATGGIDKRQPSPEGNIVFIEL